MDDMHRRIFEDAIQMSIEEHRKAENYKSIICVLILTIGFKCLLRALGGAE